MGLPRFARNGREGRDSFAPRNRPDKSGNYKNIIIAGSEDYLKWLI